jgi:hypothetical protein
VQRKQKDMRNKRSSEEWLFLEREFAAEVNRQMNHEGEALPKSSREGCTSPADGNVPFEMLHGVYVLRLVEEGVPVEKAFDLIIEGMLRPN